MTASVSVPSIFQPPEGELVASRVRHELASSLTSRRSLLRGLAALTMALAVASLDMLPRIGQRASAVPPTRVDCTYPDAWKICNPDAASVSSTYCNENGYHRRDSDNNACQNRDYVRDWRCGPHPNGGDYNAWVWRRNWGPNTGPPDVRCSDGLIHVTLKAPCETPDTFTVKSTCKRLL